MKNEHGTAYPKVTSYSTWTVTGTHPIPPVGALYAKAAVSVGERDIPDFLIGDEPSGVREGRVGGRVQLRERRHDHAGGDRRAKAVW